jgi:glycine oxidase
MTEARDVVIVGGGVIGLSIAFSLARAGIRPLVVDRRDLGREASWAGAGLIPPVAEYTDGHPLVALRSWSAALYPGFSLLLAEVTGIDIGYRRTGGVDVAWTEREDHELRAAAGRWRKEGIGYERLPPGDYARVEPALNPELLAVY